MSTHFAIFWVIGFHTIGVLSFRALMHAEKAGQSRAGSGRSWMVTSNLWDNDKFHVWSNGMRTLVWYDSVMFYWKIWLSRYEVIEGGLRRWRRTVGHPLRNVHAVHLHSHQREIFTYMKEHKARICSIESFFSSIRSNSLAVIPNSLSRCRGSPYVSQLFTLHNTM